VTGTQVSHRFALLSLQASFVQTVKACQPIFTAGLSFLWIQERCSLRTYLSLLVIVAGVVVSCMAEVEWNGLGLVAVLTSTFFIAFTSVGTKRALKSHPELNDHTMWCFAAQGTAVVLLPYFAFGELRVLLSETRDWGPITFKIIVIAGLTSMATRISMKVLSLVSPMSHSVVVSVKRLFVIGMAIIYFGNIPTLRSVLGMAAAAWGTVLYSRSKSKDKAASKGTLPLLGENRTERGEGGVMERAAGGIGEKPPPLGVDEESVLLLTSLVASAVHLPSRLTPGSVHGLTGPQATLQQLRMENAV